MITRPGFLMPWRYADNGMPPPLACESAVPAGNWYPSPRPLQASRNVQPGPGLIFGGSGNLSLGIDPTDPTTWGKRGYRTCAGMVGRLNGPDDWQGYGELNPLEMP